MQGSNTREIGRAAIRRELALTSMALFVAGGFDRVTFDDLAAAAGVSRSTFLRYFASKEDVVLFVFDPLGESMIGALASRPPEEGEWPALRRAVDPAVALVAATPTESLALLRLIWDTPALVGRLHDKQASWRPGLVEVLMARQGGRDSPVLAVQTRVMAALGCLLIAFDAWVGGAGEQDLRRLVDFTFEALGSID